MDDDIKKTVIQTLFFALVMLLITVGTYVLNSKWICCCNGKRSLLDTLLVTMCVKKILQKISEIKCCSCCYSCCCCKREEDEVDETSEIKNPNQRSNRPLCGSNALVNIVAFAHVSSKVIMVISNITYLIIISNVQKKPFFNPKQEEGRTLSYYLTFLGSIHEIIYILLLPIFLAACHSCWKITSKTFCAYLRYGDLQFALTFAPFVSVHLHYLGGWYWIFIVIRVVFYSTTFVAVVIVGIRFLIAVYCWKLVDIACCGNADAVEIKDFKHLFRDVGIQLITVMTKLLTGSSALATYFKIAVIQKDPVRYVYLGFTLLSCANAVASLLYNAILLRWVVMKEDDKADDSIGSKTLEILKFKAPCSHISFALGLIINLGLIGLNSYILGSGNYRV